jgi:hypothetical protein
MEQACMSTAEAKLHPTAPHRGTKDRTEWAHLPVSVTVTPAPARMIFVQVYKNDDGSFAASWAPVVGLLCVVENEYMKRVGPNQDSPKGGATHEEMIELGWRRFLTHDWIPEIWPVVVGNNDSSESSIRVAHPRLGCSNCAHETVALCTWPPEEDAENAKRIGHELLESNGDRTNWIELTPRPEESSPAA